MDDTITSFGSWLRRRRKALDLTQDALASAVGCSKELIAKIEQDARRPSKQVAELLARTLGLAENEMALFVRAARAELAADRLPIPTIGVPQPTLHVPTRTTATTATTAQIHAFTSLTAPSTNLPAQVNALIGRTRDVAKVLELLSRARLVTLTGPGGTGKTRLALQVGADMLDQYADGVWFIDLSPTRDPDQIAPMMIQALSIPESPTRSTMASICDWLHHRRILLIIDNCEQVITAVADFVAQLLRAAAQLTILATSRIPLRLSAEYEYAVDTLGLPDPNHLPSLEQFSQYNAVALFVTRARAVRADFAITTTNAPAVAEICVRLDGLPLAIELAAARIRFFSPEQLLSRLMIARMQTLIGGARDLPTRQQTMRATIDWSYRLLNTHEQDLFARLAVFVGGWTLEAAATIGDFRLSIAAIGEPGGDAHRATDMHADTISNLPIDIVNLLDALVEHSLVRLQETDSEPRYTMLETLHEYALEQLQERGEESLLRERHAAYFVTFAEAIEQQRMQGSDSWRTRFHPEQANLDAVIAWSCRIADDQRIGIRLAQALDQYCKQEGQHQRAYQYLIQLSNAYTNRATVDQMRLLGLQGHKLFDLDQYRRALAAYDQACPWLIANGYPQEACERLEEASRCARNLQDLDRAYALAEQSRKLIEQYDIEAQSGWNAMSFGDIATDHGDFDQAERFYNEGLQKSEAHHNSYAAGCALMARARMWQAANHPEQAMADYQAALRIHRTIAPGMAQVELLEISWLLYDQGRHEPLSDLIRENMMITSDHKNHNVLLLVGYLNVAHHPQRATRLLSAFAMAEQRLLGEISPFPAELQQQFDTQLQRLREQLGDTAFEAAWAVGQSFAWKHILADIVAWLDDADTINV